MNVDLAVGADDPIESIPDPDVPDTVSIFRTLALLPSGVQGEPLTPEELGRYLAVNYNTDVEKDRNDRHALRDELYRDGGIKYMTQFIDYIFDDPTVRKLRQKWVKHGRYNNVTKRLVNELSSVYSEPAKRIVGDISLDPDALSGEADEGEEDAATENDKYQRLLELVRMDERAIEINRLLNLHRVVLVGFRVRQLPSGAREPVIDIATPANVRAIMHPNDNTLVIGWMIRCEYRTARLQSDRPAWTVWTDHESFQLRDDMTVIGGSLQEHELGLCPWIPVALGVPQPGFWPGNEGEDIVSAHVSTWLINILHLKEAKSATKQTMVTGDGTAVGRGQAADSEVPIELADGQSATTVDMSMDLEMFTRTTDHVIQNTAQNYGISPALITHQGVQSAQARELMRLPLRELRRQQQVPLRRFERQFALVMARVCAVDAPALAFDPDDWRIEFAESETPLDPLAELMLFERRRAAGLTNTLEFMRLKYPGSSDADLFRRIEDSVAVELTRNTLMRPLQAIQGSLDAALEAAAGGARATVDEQNLTDSSPQPRMPSTAVRPSTPAKGV